MANTPLPLIAAVCIFAVGAVLIQPNVERGQGGPEVNAGILRLPKRDPLRTVSAPLAGSTAATRLSGTPDDGLWRVAVIAGMDREPVTRATMLALGEALYAAGMVAIMDPSPTAADPAPPLPMAADRVISVGTVSASIPEDPAAGWQATVELRIDEPRLPAGHPGAGLLSPPLIEPLVLRIEHDGRPGVGEAPGWPERWAATGRAVVSAALGAALPPSGLRRPEAHIANDWGTPIPFPPTTPELRWAGAFQQDLVRGWTGRVNGLTVSTSAGGSEPAAAPVERLLKRGAWEAVEPEAGWRQWSRLKDGQRQWFALRAERDGWAATMWLERPDAAGLVDGWIVAGDEAARAHLRRLLSLPALPEALRARIEAARP